MQAERFLSTSSAPTDLIPGFIQLQLVHNKGAAWGIFYEGTLLLGIVSVVLCVIFLYIFLSNRSTFSLCETIGIALLFAGGVGNAIDRFTQSYVTDFISTEFISFPVFNIADIGVTCGIVLFFIGYLVRSSKQRRL